MGLINICLRCNSIILGHWFLIIARYCYPLLEETLLSSQVIRVPGMRGIDT